MHPEPERRINRAAQPPPRKLRRSPQRFALRSAVSVVTATLLCVLVTLIRDQNNKRVFIEAADAYRVVVQDQWEETGFIPPDPAELSDSMGKIMLDVYADENTRFYALHAETPTIIGYTSLVQLYTAYNGRAVLFFGRDGVSVEWINEGRFQRMIRAQRKRVEKAIQEVRSRAPRLPE